MKYYILHIIFWVSILNLKGQDLHVSLTKTDEECKLGKANITILSAALPYHVLWSTGSTENEVNDLEEGAYSVYIKDDHNHDTTIYFAISELVCEPVPYNHFTPNGDGFYDTWTIGGLEPFPTFELFVYNRWGQQIHHQLNVYTPWDGKSLGLPVPDGTYYYILFLSRSDKDKFIKGSVSILR